MGADSFGYENQEVLQYVTSHVAIVLIYLIFLVHVDPFLSELVNVRSSLQAQ